MYRYAKPTTLDEALSLLAAERWRILAGGTDFYPAQGARPIRDHVLDINALDGLRGVATAPDGVRIGARTTWSDVIRADLPPAFDALKQAAREVGSVQIQNAGTVAGNLCNASPAADGAPPLMTLDAEVELASTLGGRRLPLGEFILGNRSTARLPHELVVAVHVPANAMSGRSAFRKLGARRYLVISIAMVAARLIVERGRIVDAAVAVGACSAVAMRLNELERDLIGRPADGTLAEAVRDHHVARLAPIDDVRATAGYRSIAAREIVGEALLAAIGAPPLERVA